MRITVNVPPSIIQYMDEAGIPMQERADLYERFVMYATGLMTGDELEKELKKFKLEEGYEDEEEGSGYSYSEYKEGDGASEKEIQGNIDHYKKNPFVWKMQAKKDFEAMAAGESADIKDEHYPEWKKEDFVKVLTALDESPNMSEDSRSMTFESFIQLNEKKRNSLKELVGKDDEEELDLDDARRIGRKVSKMTGDDRKKFVGIINFMGASCRIYNEIWANYKTVDPERKDSNKGKAFRGEKPQA